MTLERALWRWALVAALLALAFVLARAGRYQYVECVGKDLTCMVLNRWTGEVELRPIVLPLETERALREKDHFR